MIMTLVPSNPTSPGRRFVIKIATPDLHKGRPVSALLRPKKRINGRNNAGRITVRRRGGGHKKHYRVIDFKRDKNEVTARVERIEYDPNRTAHLALLLYADGERRYIIAPKELKVGDELQSGVDAPIRAGNCLPLSAMPIGSTV